MPAATTQYLTIYYIPTYITENTYNWVKCSVQQNQQKLAAKLAVRFLQTLVKLKRLQLVRSSKKCLLNLLFQEFVYKLW